MCAFTGSWQNPGVICVAIGFIHLISMVSLAANPTDCKSDYKWSTLVILLIQTVGVMLGMFVPAGKCLATLSFKLSITWLWHNMKVLKVESYWTQKLSDWKRSSILFPSSSFRLWIVFYNLQVLILNFLILFQMAIVVVCKTIRIIVVLLSISVFYLSCCLKRRPQQHNTTVDLQRYALQLRDDMELREITVKRISKAVNRLIEKSEKQQPENLKKLIEKSIGFERVGTFDSHDVPTKVTEPLNCWSLALVTLTTIALSLPRVQKNLFHSLMNGVREGLKYVTLIEESLNDNDDHISVQKAVKTLWLDVQFSNEWLGKKVRDPASREDTTAQIVQSYMTKATKIVTRQESVDIGCPDNNPICKSIANSMYRITNTIVLSYQGNNDIDQVSEGDLFQHLSLMISEILAACLTNLPQVIKMKCNSNAIEKREASVHAAAKLLGQTTQIISILQARTLPSMNADEKAFIDKWRDNLKHSSSNESRIGESS